MSKRGSADLHVLSTDKVHMSVAVYEVNINRLFRECDMIHCRQLAPV